MEFTSIFEMGDILEKTFVFPTIKVAPARHEGNTGDHSKICPWGPGSNQDIALVNLVPRSLRATFFKHPVSGIFR
jgi:hypothetical protein